MQIQITGLQELNASLAKMGPAVIAAADRGLKTAGMHIIADAQDTLRRENINTTGLLSQSGKVVKDKDGYDVGFMSDKSYASAVEYGRRAGRIPPPDVMAAYAYKKFHLNDRKLARAIGWGLAINIGKHGTRPHPFFGPAVQKNQGRVVSAIKDAVAHVINRTGNV